MLKHIFILSFLFVAAFPVFSQQVDDMVKQADLLEKQMKEEDAYQKFKDVVKLQPHNLYALTRCSELASRIGRRQSTPEKQMDYYTAAKIYAQRALKISPDDSEANVVMSLAYARMSLLKDGKEKIEYVREIKNYADKALKTNPNNFKAVFIIARWHFELSNLNAIQKAAVKVFYGGVQANSLDSAIYYYEKVRSLSPNFNLNYLELAKAYYRKNNKKKAADLLNYMLRLPNTAADDNTVKEEARQLLAIWKV